MTIATARSQNGSPSTLAIYLSEINQTSLLSAEEEVELAQRIREGDTAARDKFIRANLRLVVCIGRAFRGHGASAEDLIEEGNLGLIRAVERFDPSRNTRFSTFASYWIRQSMMRCVGASRVLPLPSYVVQLLRNWRRESNLLEEELSRPPSDEEINERLQLSTRKVRIINRAFRVLSSKRTGANESERNLDELLAGKQNGPENRLVTKELLSQALYLLDRIDEREAKVLRMRFGLQGFEPTTLARIGERMGMTRERVRQIETEALLKLQERMDPSTSADRRDMQQASSRRRL